MGDIMHTNEQSPKNVRRRQIRSFEQLKSDDANKGQIVATDNRTVDIFSRSTRHFL